jgi:hypothetical protein
VFNSVSENDKLRRLVTSLEQKMEALDKENKEKVGDEKKLKISL